jgi:hypothetical protein
MYFESEALNKIGYLYYQESRLIIPPVSIPSQDDRLLYGIVRDRITRESLSGAFVEVYPGHIDIVNGDFTQETLMFCAYSGQDELFDEGYYEFYVPQGQYTIRVTRGGYLASDVVHINVGDNGLRKDMVIDTIAVYGFIYDATVFGDTGTKVPLSGAVAVVTPYAATSIHTDYNETTDGSGEFNIHYPATPSELLKVSVSRNGYAGIELRIPVRADGTVRKIEVGLHKSEIYRIPR